MKLSAYTQVWRGVVLSKPHHHISALSVILGHLAHWFTLSW